MIVVDNNSFVIGSGTDIQRVFENNENLIKVIKENGKFYYIANGDSYNIISIDTPDDSKYWFYIDEEFVEATENN